jgi:uncharacterized protein
MRVRNLSMLECTKLLAANRIGHLACASEGRPYVVPIYYAYGNGHVYAFCMPGKKLDYMRANPLVSLIVEEPSAGRQWRSVIVDGQFEELPDRKDSRAERDHAWSLLSRHSDWWEPGALTTTATAPVSDHTPHVFFRIVVDQVTGREAKE